VGATPHTITSVKLKLWRSGSPSGNFIVGIRATDGSGHPTGSDLTSGSISAGSIPTTATVMEISVTEYLLSANTKYAIVVRVPDGNSSNCIYWRNDQSSPTYAGGNWEDSTNSGSSWTANTAWDGWFEVWGNPAETNVSVSDTGVGTEVVGCGRYQPVSDSGMGSETVGTIGNIPISETGAGADAINLLSQIACADLGQGSETTQITTDITLADDGVGVEGVEARYYRFVHDSGIGAEFGWRLKGSCLIDSFELPHVLTIRIIDEAAMSSKEIQGGEVPRRSMMGKPGRVVEITGWTKNQSDIDAMEALKDGTSRTFIHPSGDSFAVLITQFLPDQTADRYNRRFYRMTLKETRE